jgi:hypothetical protein
MPPLDIEENIKKIQEAIELTYQEVYRLQGSLRIFMSLKENGLKTIDLPEKKKEDQSEEQETKTQE